MTKTHIIENGVVVNTILATVAEAQAAYPQAVCVDGATGSIGWLWDGATLSAPPVPPKTPEQLREEAKALRATAVENIKVTTAAGNTFDGDEASQARMSRAILVLSTGAAASVPWVLADNTVIQADIAELTEALALAGAEQARLWVLPWIAAS